ncbi:MAG: Calx-beta domain-containing protein [Xanthomonadales bacterium]|jgi:hypothetical protein|nr:Calx-beta domain-containing protein [Xanthomonadales bacterium]
MHKTVPILLVLAFFLALPITAMGQSTVTLSVNDALAGEAGQDPGSFTVTRSDSGNTAAALFVWVTIGGNATAGVDYTLTNAVFRGGTDYQVTIPAGQLSTPVTLTPLRDNLDEGAENFTVELRSPGTAGSDYTIGNPNSAELTIADDVAEVTVTLNDGSADEAGQDPGSFTVTRSDSGNTAAALFVWVTIGGNATAGVDYTLTNAVFRGGTNYQVTIPAGQLSTIVTLTPVFDLTLEGDETATITLRSPGTASSDYAIGDPSDVLIVIRDRTEAVFKDGFEP